VSRDDGLRQLVANVAAERIVKSVPPLVSRVLAAFDAENLPWSRVPDHPSVYEAEQEVELLIPGSSGPRAREILRSFEFVPVTTSHEGAHGQFVGRVEGDERWTRIHLTTELAFGMDSRYLAPMADSSLARRTVVDGVATLAGQDTFWVLLLRGLLDERGFDPVRTACLAELTTVADIGSEWASFLAPMFPPSWNIARLVAAASRQEWGSLRALGPGLAAQWTRRYRWHVMRRRLAHRLGRITNNRNPFHGPPGLTVALLGPDGSGKSTLATSIACSFPFPARTIYLGLWQAPARRGTPLLPGTDLLGRLGFAWRRWIAGRYHRARGSLVVFDRYPYDALLALHGGQRLRERLYFELLGRSCPAPDLVFLLDTPGRVAFARKGEHDIAQLESIRQGYLALCARLPAIELVDGDRPLGMVQTDLVDRIWESYRARWRVRGRLG